MVERNLAADPVPVETVLAPGRPVAARDEWRSVTAAGEYDADATVVVRYQTRDGASGVDVVTPLRLDRLRHRVLVDRGWMRDRQPGRRRRRPPRLRPPAR